MMVENGEKKGRNLLIQLKYVKELLSKKCIYKYLLKFRLGRAKEIIIERLTK